jgi:outer membrane protein assembly factor BamD
MKQINLYIILLLGILLSACSHHAKVLKTTDYYYKYEVAKQYYAEGLYNRSSLLLSEVVLPLKGTDRGEESLFLMAMATFNSRNYDAATNYFKKYYESYPRGLYTEEARFYCGQSLFMNIPETKLDQTATYEAVTEFQNFLELYPNGRFSLKAQELIFELQDRLVEKEYLSAQLYYDLGSYFGNCNYGGSNYQACIITAENAIIDYPYTSRREDFAILILKAKFELAQQSVDEKKEDRFHDAIDEYYGFTTEFPESKFIEEAHKLFKKAQPYVKDSGHTTDH